MFRNDPDYTERREEDPEANALKNVFGARAMSSSYNRIEVELTASPNDVHWWNRYEIMISSSHPNVAPVTQEDVNAIVASLKPIPHS